MNQQIENRSGSLWLNSPLVVILILLFAVGLGYLISIGSTKSVIAILAIPPILLYFNRLFVQPRIGLYTIIVLAFIAIGLTRYILNVPLGLSIDGMLVLTYVAVFFKYFYNKLDFLL